MNNNKIQIDIANVLRTIGSKKCLEKARVLEGESSSISILHLRDSGLNSSNIISIANCLKQAKENNSPFLKSVSFSYNYDLGDLGAIALATNLPKSICEIGLVNCGISDIGGIELLNWMKNAPHLRMICIEQNNFSENLKLEFKNFSTNHSNILVVF